MENSAEALPITKRQVRGFVDRLADLHYDQLGHSGYMICQCQLAVILRDMTKAAADNRGRRRKR
jgi:hypothetical protein